MSIGKKPFDSKWRALNVKLVLEGGAERKGASTCIASEHSLIQPKARLGW